MLGLKPQKNREEELNYWQSISDVMTALLVIILLIALFFQQFRGNRVVENVFLGIRPAVTALILGPIFKLSKAAAITWRTVWMPIVAALLIWQLGVSPIWIIIAGILGGIARYFTQQKGGKA